MKKYIGNWTITSGESLRHGWCQGSTTPERFYVKGFTMWNCCNPRPIKLLVKLFGTKRDNISFDVDTPMGQLNIIITYGYGNALSVSLTPNKLVESYNRFKSKPQ